MTAAIYILICLLALGLLGIFLAHKAQGDYYSDGEPYFAGPDEKAPEVPAAAPHFDGILTARPAGMDFTTYCQIRREQNRRLRSYLKNGTLVYLASELYQVGNQLYKRTYMPFVGSAKRLKLGETLCSKRKKEAPCL